MMKDNVVHQLYGITGHAVISTLCYAAMQGCGKDWSNEINHWGKIGIVRHEPFTTVTLDPDQVTCKACRLRRARLR